MSTMNFTIFLIASAACPLSHGKEQRQRHSAGIASLVSDEMSSAAVASALQQVLRRDGASLVPWTDETAQQSSEKQRLASLLLQTTPTAGKLNSLGNRRKPLSARTHSGSKHIKNRRARMHSPVLASEALADLIEKTEAGTFKHAVPKQSIFETQANDTTMTATEASAKSDAKHQHEELAYGTPTRVEQNAFGSFADAASSTVFSVLHANDGLGIKDSSKNLRVLWSRALLNLAGQMKDPIAYQMLPPSTRDVINLLPRDGPLVNFQEFIVSRTSFIDGAVSSFLDSPAVKSLPDGVRPQIVLFGAGYDTRSMRLNKAGDFFEVDLPDVVEGKGKLQQRWKEEHGSSEIKLPTRVGFNLNNAIDEKLTDVLEAAGLQRDRPTLFVWEAVLFYVKPEAIMAMFDNVLRFGGESVFCLVDSLKPAVSTSFQHEARAFFERYGLELLDHNSRWGGAVHFALAGTRDSKSAATIREERGEMPFSYLPSSFEGGIDLQDHSKASFRNVWYAVAYSSQVGNGTVFATRLWGEPIVLYRDAEGSLVAAKDSCPHRSAPLSMGKMNEQGNLECFYHGWSFGEDGKCKTVPTKGGSVSEGFAKKACLQTYAVEERDDLIYIWHGENVLTADARKLPKLRKDVRTYPVDTVLDYNVDFEYIVENNLDSPHLFWLHDGSVPPVKSLNYVKEKVNQVKLAYFEDGSGSGHYGQTAGGKPKIVRFDAPNIVRHGGVSSFHEEFHIVPIARGRTRVLLRQHLPRGPILDTALQIPGVPYGLKKLVQLWNYHISLEDYSVMQGQAHNIDDLGAPHLAVGDLGDDVVAKFYKWKDAAVKNDGNLPYFSRWTSPKKGHLDYNGASDVSQVAEKERFVVRDDRETVDGKMVGTFGVLRSYNQDQPHEVFPPVNYKKYSGILKLDQLIKRAVGQETRWLD
jgi:methyltransferase (TIGR00027 family)